jgi:uncharacterized protein YlzI (FlbEa/FlbD family)
VIKLTDRDGDVCYVKPEHISAMLDLGNKGTSLIMLSGKWLQVKERIEDVYAAVCPWDRDDARLQEGATSKEGETSVAGG